MTTREQQQTKENFSKILADCRSLAMTITRDRRIKVRYDPKMPTSAFAMETNEITLSLTPYPDFVKTQPFLFKKILDGDLAHECVLKGTQILTIKGFKPIEQVQTGDMVSSDGKFVTVLRTTNRDYKGELITIKAMGILPFSVTANHKIAIKRSGTVFNPSVKCEWKEAEFLRVGDRVFVPKLRETTLIFDNSFMELLGVFVGDGCVYIDRHNRGKDYITFALANQEEANHVLDLCKQLFGKGRVYYRKTRTNNGKGHYEVSFDDTRLPKFLKEKCYNERKEKQIPEFVYESSASNTEAFFNGLFLADGSFELNGAKRITTVSYDVAVGLQKLLTKIDKFATVSYQIREKDTVICGHTVHQKNRFIITLNENKKKVKEREFQNGFWVKITKLERKQIAEMVFNLSTETVNYDINNIKVKNCGHHIFTKPLWDYFNNWVTRIKRQRGFYRLAHEVCNIVEDKRINHFIILRYRFDVGKRLLLANLILKDMIDNTVEPKAIQKGNFTTLEETASGVQAIDNGLQEGVYIMAILCNQGLYEAKCTEFWNKLTPIAKADCIRALKVLEDVKYKRLRIDIIRACQELYDLIAKHLKADYTSRQYIVSRRGGTLKGDISPELRAKLEAEAKKELDGEEKDKHLKDIQKGSGAGEGSISGESKVYAKIDGKLWFGTIFELENQKYQKLEVLTVENSKIIWKEAKLINHGTAQLYKITLKSGKEIKATANHNLFKRRFAHSSSSRLFEMIRTDNLKVGDSIAIPSYLPINASGLQIEQNLTYLVGLWLADGSFNDNRTINISLDERDTETIEKLRKISFDLGLTLHEKYDHGHGKTYRLCSRKLVKRLESLGCTYPKQIPNWVFLASDTQIVIFLEGYIAGDGYIPQDEKHKRTVQISCVDRTVLVDLQTLFLRLNTFSHISENKGNRKGKNPIWVLETTRKRYPEITFRQVKSIEPSGIESIYDFSVPETEKFIANNILLHNTGEEIPAPEPDFAHYYELLDACKPEITELLNRLKKQMKPRVSREIFQKRGRIMSPIVPKIFANSFRGTIKNVFTGIDTKFEKEQIKIGFMFDFSGSVDKEQAEKITTILNEVFGHYVRDGDFAITCFGADSQKVKVFNETFNNTKARVGNIGVNACGTEISVLLESFLRMFNGFRDIRKVLVIASDFEVCDEEKALDLLEQYAKSGIEVLLIGFSGCEKVETFANNIKKLKVKRTRIQEICELPSAFLNAWTNYQKDKP